jgi:hypothetical protein
VGKQLNSGLDNCCILNSELDEILPFTLLMPFITDILLRGDIGAERAILFLVGLGETAALGNDRSSLWGDVSLSFWLELAAVWG